MVVSLFLVGTQGLPRAVRLRTGCGAFLTNRRRKAWLFYSKSNPRRFQRLLRVLRHVSAEIKKPPDGGFLISGGDTGTPSRGAITHRLWGIPDKSPAQSLALLLKVEPTPFPTAFTGSSSRVRRNKKTT